MEPVPNSHQGGASNSMMHDKKMYSPATIRRALDLVKTSEPGKSKHDPRKQGSLREAAAVAGVASAETVRQWLKKDMSQEAIKKRLSKRGRKRKLDDLLLQKLRGYLEKHHREQTPYTQSDVIAFVAKETDGQILLTNVDVTRYTQRLGFAKQQRRPGESDEEDNLGFLQSAGMESSGALGGSMAQGSTGMYTGQSMYGAPQLINTGFNTESLKYPTSPSLFGAYLGGGSQGQMSQQQQPGGQQSGGLPKSIYQPVAPPPPPPPVQALQYFAKKYASANGLPPLPLMPNMYSPQQQQQQQQQSQQQQGGSMQPSGQQSQQPAYQNSGLMYSSSIPLSQQAALNRFLAQQYPSFNMPATSAGQGGVPQLQELNFPPLHSGGSMGLPAISSSAGSASSGANGGSGGGSLNGAASSLSALSSDANDAMNLFGLRGFPTSLSSDLQSYQQQQQQQQQPQQQSQQQQQQQQPLFHLSQQEAAGSYRPEGLASSQTEPEE